jgi:CheY-like chemotaxis protein
VPKRILVADDEAHIRRVLELKLKSAGYGVTAVASGAAALEEAKKIVPHLILSDYQMPGEMTGLDLIREVRGTPELSEIPVILLTGSVAIVEKLKAALPDIDKVTYMAKPFSPRKLLQEITVILGEEEGN